MTKILGPIHDYANGLKRKFLAHRRRTLLELQGTLMILGWGGGGFFVVDGENYITRENRPMPDRI